MMLPAFSFTHCLGVILRYPCHLLQIYQELQTGREGLNQRLLMSSEATTRDFRLVEREIEKALQVAVESHAITLGQVWVTFENLHRKKRRRY
ncbi:hypothetical protein Hdeb2414_s0002g00047521 [Helianthus debilis subsp. tardiflorus]